MNNLPMMNDQQIAAATTEELKKHLAGSLEITAKHLNHMALVWRELELRGEDLSDLRHGIAAYLPMIAHGKVEASIVIKYAGQKTLLAALSRLHIEDQRRISETGYVPVVVERDGVTTTVETPLPRLSARDVFTVFGDDGIRTVTEQTKLLKRKPGPPKSKIGYRRSRRVKVNAEDKVLMVSSSAADIDRVVEELSGYYGVDLAELIATAKTGDGAVNG